ncbi:hypothetical protein EHI8A_057540 [Entamoeba histolytica HM-1:IMSS-B]|uniref:Uncharacterized protein n=6 Tax=Entamoeba histolytica TaxID=5759 RepID=C4M8S0_ENTH1|nr:hypothetical protein EHI_181580 [Entamoeba histolytica HM-1:IMSS]EMD49023.1 Hypothetical protein EHI5A_071600 [Entamoeba histolytica KU27]EMH75973.1 hypothetical protein EHI8A_057540 [Entamoeba histolytica HM-1:IMSS-B]EMS13102.1 hypothetical protein KM1_110540 [Entamoeba histolytica HM-3:IMSS]ENY65467.1 hypothetical protein EHI7A_056740 [Entamoeba histolytica HM-1:IMSS-A]GAT98015.1 hypothetical protein CL6EHI_181580 [Entamoeba histolytica]|eukprot:XP_649665.1 hypothetical protein EHI_181580 [Entamoeba histolytica HM-1:IMSS]
MGNNHGKTPSNKDTKNEISSKTINNRECSSMLPKCKKSCKLSKDQKYLERDKAQKYLEDYNILMKRINNFNNDFENKTFEEIEKEVQIIDSNAIRLANTFIHAHAVKDVFNNIDYEKTQENVRDIHIACTSTECNCIIHDNHERIESLRLKKMKERQIELKNNYMKHIDCFGELYSNKASQTLLDQCFYKVVEAIKSYLNFVYPNGGYEKEQEHILMEFHQQYPNYTIYSIS